MNDRLIKLWRQISVSNKDRNVFYRVMAAQLNLGVSLHTAVKTTAAAVPSNKLAAELAKRTDRVVAMGGLITEDWRESGWLPLFDATMLMLAERDGLASLGGAMEEMVQESSKPVTIFNKVILGNAYHIGVFFVALAFLWMFADLLEQIAGRHPSVLEGQASYAASLWLRSNYIWLLALLGGAVALYKFVTLSLVGPMRRKLGIALKEHDLKIAIRYLSLCQRMASRGASHSEMTDVVGMAMTGRYANAALKDLSRLLKKGVDYMDAVGQTILPGKVAQILSGLAPAGERQALPEAYAVVSMIVGEQLTNRLTAVAAVFRTLLLMANAVIILTLVNGMYGTTTDLTDVVGRGR